jgi:hypothetical protein
MGEWFWHGPVDGGAPERAVETKHGAATAKMSRSVLSGVCGLACRLDLLTVVPVRLARSRRSGLADDDCYLRPLDRVR